MPKCIILSGAPLSGKSTWVKNNKKPGWLIISCDEIRLKNSPNGIYRFSPKMEKYIWDSFYKELRGYRYSNLIIDNTNCKLVYINKIKECLHKSYEVEIIKFEASLIVSYYRNIKRYLTTGKWIPFKVIRKFKQDYKTLWKK